MAEGRLIFISGGARSGKSAYAEQRTRESALPRHVYLASGQPSDAEMAERIRRHQKDRRGQGWLTVEQPVDLKKALNHLQPKDAVLWDCVTTYLANELFEGWETGSPCAEIQGCMEQKWVELQEAVKMICSVAGMLIVVSNEVLDEPIRHPVYQQWLGTIHRWLVAEADEAIEMENGIAFRRK